MDRLINRVAIVTGAGSGIGSAAAQLFANEGAAVGLVDVDEAAVRAASSAINRSGGRALALTADVTSDTQIRAAVAQAREAFGDVDVLYNNAGVFSAGGVDVAKEDDWARCFAINVTGTFLSSRAVLPGMLARGTGCIVNQASVAGLVGIPHAAAYCAAKGAIIALTRSMSVDLAPRGIRVNALAPGTVRTPLIEPLLEARGDGDLQKGLALTVTKYPIGRLGTPAEIAAAALFLASNEAGFITGTTLVADGGMTSM